MTSKVGRTQFAKKSLGQNFLVDSNYIGKIVAALGPEPGETVVEIGPGRGALTEVLVGSGANVIAIELDRELVSFLRERFEDDGSFRVIEQDVLTADLDSFLDDVRSEIQGPRTVKLVANLPYYISTAILQRLIEQRQRFAEIVLMFQLEVVERITAPPGSSDRGFLTVLVESAFDVEKLFDVPPKAFRPVPKVTSAVVRLTPKPDLIDDFEEFRELLSTAFAQKRKTILNNLKSKYAAAADALERAGIDPKRRAESLTLQDWFFLFAALFKASN